MQLSKRRVKIERTEYLANGLTPEQAKKNRIRWLKIFDLCSSVIGNYFYCIYLPLPSYKRCRRFYAGYAQKRRLAYHYQTDGI